VKQKDSPETAVQEKLDVLHTWLPDSRLVTPFHFFTFPPKTVKAIIITLLFVILLSSCAGPKGISEREKLHRELLKWESFDSQGVVEISIMGLAMRKMFSAAKNQRQMRFDIFDGGIMGAGAKPLISLYLGDYITLKSPYMPMLEMLSLGDNIPVASLNLFGSADSLAAKYGQGIIKDKRVEIDSVAISFLPDYRLDKVIDLKSKTEIKANYSNNGKLQELAIKGTDNLSVRLIFDKIDYTPPQIVPLPKSASHVWPGALKGFDGLDLKSLLKEYLNKK